MHHGEAILNKGEGYRPVPKNMTHTRENSLMGLMLFLEDLIREVYGSTINALTLVEYQHATA